MGKITLFAKKTTVSFAFFLITFFSYSQNQTFTSNGTFTCPAGVTSVTVEAWGGGGKGSTRSTSGEGGGGGGGAYSQKEIAVIPGYTYTVTVGSGSSSTSAGGDSWFLNSTTILAKGGNSVADNNNSGGTGGNSSGCIGTVTFSGGNGANSFSTGGGGGGSSAGTLAIGTNGSTSFGGIAPSGGGNGGAGATSNANGTPGGTRGAGGGGAYKTTGSTKNGGWGANGLVTITYPAPLIIVQANATTILDGDSTPTLLDWTDFNSTDITVGTVTRTFTIFNLPSAGIALSIGAITISGTNAADFTVTALPLSNLAIGNSTTFQVTFNPSATGTRNATINIASNDATKNPYNFAIKGTGDNPEINVFGNLISISDGDITPSVSDNTDFGTVSIFGGSTVITYTIQNTGIGNLNLGAITFSGANASNFSLITAPPSIVPASSSATFQVSFSPTTIGTKTATLSIVNDDSNENPYDFAVAGLGARAYPDTDGDNVPDNIDIDDDNDGILDLDEEAECASSPFISHVLYTFLNETFGTGTTKGLININVPTASCTYCFEDGIVGPNTVQCPSQSTWILDDGEYTLTYKIAGTLSSDPENIHGDLAWNGLVDHTPGDTNGRMAVFNASFAPGIFYETTIEGVMPNIPITYSFYALNIMSQSTYPGSILPNITVEFLDTSNNVLSTFNTGDIGRCNGSTADNTCAYSAWKQYTTSVNLGANTNFTIRFKNNAPGGGGNDLALDDIVIKQLYSDTDSDGVANIFDLDCDNDGISDIEEAGFKSLSGGLSTMDLTAVTWVDANENGLNDFVDAQITAATYLVPDTDGDSVKDYLDLDSDNDSIFDSNEAGLANGDGDVNDDGIGEGVDSDLDGILNFFDTLVGFATTSKPFTTDTDGNGNPDYTSIDSDNDGINDIVGTLYNSLDTDNDGKIDAAIDVDRDGIVDSFDTAPAAQGSPRDLNRKLFLDFDGKNDYGQGTAILGGLSSASMMAWINLNTTFASNGFVVGQEKFQLRINSAKKLEAVVNGTMVSFSTALTPAQWYNVAAVYGGGNLKVYLNGALVMTQSMSGSISADASLLTIGKDPLTSSKYFKGKIDEVRIFNVALTDSQLQRMVYQEIQNTNSQVRGLVVPKDVGGLAFANVLRYYRMDAYKNDIIDDLTTAAIDSGSGMKIYNHKNIYEQEAPMPFNTERSGTFAEAVDSPKLEIRGMDIMDQDWSIVNVMHDINEPSNNVDLGMFVFPGINIIASNDNKIQNDWYLKLDGTMDLQRKSQLVQTINSDLDVTSAGSIERDQQGQSNKYNYNYWCSPVGRINTDTNNTAYTVDLVMKDATNPSSIQNITWTSGLDSSPTTPITLSSRWIYKFQNTSPVYANWTSLGQYGSLLPAQGFTLKGSNAATPTQNYTFIGKPNSGAMSNPIASNNLNLCGNPYPSAIDCNEFIHANINDISGTVYFWEHFATNFSHVLVAYQGGYAARNLTGGTPPHSPAGISGAGTSTRIPARYIPVGQGFFVNGRGPSGVVAVDNSMRAFVKEDDVDGNIMFRQSEATAAVRSTVNNNSDATSKDSYGRIRLGFNSPDNTHVQILLGFMDQLASKKFDRGYDGPIIEDQPSDMYFTVEDQKCVIQGDGHFNTNNIYDLGIKTAADGMITVNLDATENFDEQQNIYIYDNVTGIYHDIRAQAFVGSSRVDLQACKLEYSIVSPK